MSSHPSLAVRLLTLLVPLVVGLPAGGAQAEPPLQMDQVRALPPLPSAYQDESSVEKRLAWLQQRLAQPQTPAERYRLQRALSHEQLEAHRLPEAAALCAVNPPLRDDLMYRQRCILSRQPEFDRALPELLALIEEARALGKPDVAAQVLSGIAWRQSQAGDVAGAFGNFEAALALMPADRPELLRNLMMDTATSYIVNGDDAYVRKGIALLQTVREQMQRLLLDPAPAADQAQLRDDIALTEFNQGIAQLLHLDDAAQALPHFDRAAREANPYRGDAASFAAYAAAELGQSARARGYLALAATAVGDNANPVVAQYLACYRQLALRRIGGTQALPACLALKPETAVEVQVDLYKRLIRLGDPVLVPVGHKGLARLFTETFEPQLRRRGAHAASRAELQRLQLESERKSLVLQQQADLQRARDATAAQRLNTFVAVLLLLVAVVLLVALQWRAKQKLAAQYERLSLVDSLTELGNRRFLEQQMGRELSHLQRARRTNPNAALGLYLFDIDHFKSVNDRLGHAVGDAVLIAFARRVQSTLRETDLLVRWGGEEFLLVARIENAEHCSEVAERTLRAVNGRPFEVGMGDPLPVTCTIGALSLPFLPGDGAQPWSALVGLADLALYEGKALGRNRWVEVQNLGINGTEVLSGALQRPLRESVAAGQLQVRSSTG